MTYRNLFNRFPREFGRGRTTVNSYDELVRRIELHNGLRDVFVSLYDTNFVIDKIFFDIDSKNLNRAFFDTRILIGRIEKCGYPYIPVFSGRKGFHIYIPIMPWKAPNLETAKTILRDIQEKLAGDIESADKHVFGDIRRLVRYPNTLNGNNYCVPLPHDFVYWDVEKIVEYSKTRHDIEYEFDVLPSIEAMTDLDLRDYDTNRSFKTIFRYDLPGRFRLASRLLRPCVAQLLAVDRDPPHEIRMDLVAELMWLGWSEEKILEVIRDLNWIDFDPNITMYQIKQIFRKRYLPLSCKRIRYFTKCMDCGWWYWWGSV